MNQRILGRTNLKVSVIGFGGLQLQKLTKKQSLKIINKAIDLGINYFDTASRYGDSEAKIGNAVRQRKEDVIIATKIHSTIPRIIDKQIKRSFKELRTKSIDIVQVHGVNTKIQLDTIMIKNGVVDVLKEYKKEGKIGFIGISGNNPKILNDAIKSNEFDTVLFPYNLALSQPYNSFTFDIEKKLIPLTKKMNIGTICMQPISHGFLSSMNVQKIIKMKDVTASQVALSFVLSNKNIHTAIPGMSSMNHLIENSKIGNEIIKLNNKQVKILCSKSRKSIKNVCQDCCYCMPCPQGVNIPNMFKCLVYYKQYGLKKLAKKEYQMSKKDRESSDFCNNCGLCEEKCPFKIEIRKQMKIASNLFSN
jgi:predicted aldo/keto reductase-like oxidoreductase